MAKDTPTKEFNWYDEEARDKDTGEFTPEGWKKWVEACIEESSKKEERIDELEDKIKDLEVGLENLYFFCNKAGIKMPPPVTPSTLLKKLYGDNQS